MYRAYRRQDLDELIDGLHPDAHFKPVPSARTYHVRDAPIYWVGRFRDGLLENFDPYDQIDDATAAFGGRTADG